MIYNSPRNYAGMKTVIELNCCKFYGTLKYYNTSSDPCIWSNRSISAGSTILL
jgi:hypothetical protein